MLDKKDIFIGKYIDEVKKKWLEADDHFPEFLPVTSEDIKDSNNEYIQTVMIKLQEQINSFSRLPYKKQKWRQRMLLLINDILFGENVIAVHRFMDNASLQALYNELMEFLRQARISFKQLRLDEIGQAVRNYIVYAMFKLMHLDETPFSMAAFSYSMLYPFTDNYIDSKSISTDEKQRYNLLIYDKLSGARVYPRTKHQKKTCELLQAIENEYPKDSHPEIYKMLLMMLDAQILSLRQQNSDRLLSEKDRLDISLYKGGVSVLIDRFLVNKPLSEEDFMAYLGLGFFLQLADDLQDIEEDRSKGYQTLFTLNTSCTAEERIVNKLLHFIHNTLTDFRTENEVFKNFVLANCYQLIYTSVTGSSEFFSNEYVNKIVNLLPVKSDYSQKLKKYMYMPLDKKTNRKYTKMLDVIITN